MKKSVRAINGEDLGESIRFITLVSSSEESRHARLMIQSLRRFGGTLARCRVSVFVLEDWTDDQTTLKLDGVDLISLPVASGGASYPFIQKVQACAEAEKTCDQQIQTLIWCNPETFFVQPPVLLALDSHCKAAFRPVHIRNVGSLVHEPLDSYWQGIKDCLGEPEPSFTIESFVDGQRLRPYFNTHIFAIDPAAGILQRWHEEFQALALDAEFQQAACPDLLHRIFLHQAVLSVLVSWKLASENIRILPPDYSYPLHLQEGIPQNRRIHRLDDLTCAVYEDEDSMPHRVAGVEIGNWLSLWIEEAMRT